MTVVGEATYPALSRRASEEGRRIYTPIVIDACCICRLATAWWPWKRRQATRSGNFRSRGSAFTARRRVLGRRRQHSRAHPLHGGAPRLIALGAKSGALGRALSLWLGQGGEENHTGPEHI